MAFLDICWFYRYTDL